MHQALKMALIAYENDEVPIGAIVVKDNIVIGKGFNQVIHDKSVSAHAEIKAINNAGMFLDNYRLINCDIYVTLEPCHMCAKAIVDARINRIFYGAKEPKTGAIESIDRFFDNKHLNHRVKISGGHLEKESSTILKDFFRSKRNK